MLNSFLDKLTNRLGFSLTVAIMIALSTSTVLFFIDDFERLREERAQIEEGRMRNAFFAISDIQRITSILQATLIEGELSTERRWALEEAIDFLFVRTEGFATKSKSFNRVGAGVDDVKSVLQNLSDFGDAGIESDFADFETFAKGFIVESEAARRTLIAYIDEARRVEDRIVRAQADRLSWKTAVLVLVMCVLTIAGILVLILLRREVLNRHARERAEERINFLAFFDPLTDLANRVQFQDRVSRALKDRTASAFVFADINDFKRVNDAFGETAGDSVLRKTAAILTEEAERLGGFVARFGGDEFAIYLPCDDPKKLTAMCERILRAYQAPLVVDGEAISVSVNLGLSTTTQASASSELSYELVSRVTDFALYSSKLAGSGCYTLYDNELEMQFNERRAMLEELPDAVAQGALAVYLQPKAALKRGEIYGFEALVRWRRNGRLVPPGEFIEIAEESHLIVKLDYFVLKRAAHLVADWNRARGTEYSVGVNLSALHFNSGRIVDEVASVLAASGLDPKLLTLEITETVEISDWERVQNTLFGFRELGCRISIDDFGTGYSSLAYVRAMKADELKIDRSLVEEIDTSDEARYMLHSVMDLAKKLDLDVVVEGIETREQANIVSKLGARYAQGYLIGKPMPADEALHYASSDMCNATAWTSAA